MTTAERLQKLVPQVSFAGMKDVSTYWASIPPEADVMDTIVLDFNIKADRRTLCDIVSNTEDLTSLINDLDWAKLRVRKSTFQRWLTATQVPAPQSKNLQALIECLRFLRRNTDKELLRDAELAMGINIVFDENKVAEKFLKKQPAQKEKSARVELLPPPSKLETLRRRLTKSLHFEVTEEQALNYALGVTLAKLEGRKTITGVE